LSNPTAIADGLEAFARRGMEAQQAVNQLLAEHFKDLGVSPTMGQLTKHLTLLAEAKACDRRTAELQAEINQLRGRAKQLRKDAERALTEQDQLTLDNLIEQDARARAIPGFDPAASSPAMQPGEAMRMEIQIGAKTAAVTVVRDADPPPPALMAIQIGDSTRAVIPRQAYLSIHDLMPYLADEDDAIDPIVFEELMGHTKIFPPSPDAKPPFHAEIARPMKGVDGRSYAIIGARHWTKQPGENNPRAHVAITYVFRECVPVYDWPDGRPRFARFEQLPMYGSAAPENLPLDGLECTDEDGDVWILKGAEEQFTLDVVGDPIPTPEERARAEDVARTGKPQDDDDDDRHVDEPIDDRVAAGLMALAMTPPDKPEGQRVTWNQWRHNLIAAASRAALDVGEVLPIGLALELYLGCIKPATAVLLIQELELLQTWRPLPATFEVGDVCGKGAVVSTSYHGSDNPYRVVDCRRFGKTWSLTLVDYGTPEPKKGGKYREKDLRWINDLVAVDGKVVNDPRGDRVLVYRQSNDSAPKPKQQTIPRADICGLHPPKKAKAKKGKR
jgi:hypothetical protein